MKTIMYLLSSILILTFCSVACNACCIGYDPVFESNPSFEYIGSTTIKISWEKVQRNLHCADMFQVVYWETDRKEGTKMTETLIGNYVRSYNIHVKEGVAYSFAVNAIEEAIGQCQTCSWACAIGSSVCCVGNGWSGDVSVPAPTPEPVNCVDLEHCSSVTPDQCSAFSTLRTICPLKCDVEQCRPRKCEDTPECPNGVVPSICGLLGNEDKYKCNKTCGICEDVNIQGCLKVNDLWKDWGGESCQYYADDHSRCEDYDRFSFEQPRFPATNPCCACQKAFRLARGNMYNWIPETEKVFQFESKIPNDSPDGIVFKTEVRVQAFADHTLRMKFEGLGETVLVQLKRGHIKSFFVSREEPNAVTNIKRSFLSQIALGIPKTSHTVLTTPYTGIMIELLRSEAIIARLPLPSKMRKETSLLSTIHNITSSVTEDPVDLIRLCDSDKDCQEGTRCLSQCNRWACVVQCTPCTGNFCDVTEKWWGQAVDSCKCPDLSGPENPDCQLVFDEVEKTIMCHKNTSHTCRAAIKDWATAYKNAPNANDICCKYGDPNYIGSQIAWNSCSSGITDSNDQAMPTNKFRGRIAKKIGEAATWT